MSIYEPGRELLYPPHDIVLEQRLAGKGGRTYFIISSEAEGGRTSLKKLAAPLIQMASHSFLDTLSKEQTLAFWREAKNKALADPQ